MMQGVQKRKCKNCKVLFRPDHRNVDRQKYCSEHKCRKASKANSQRRWLSLPQNKDYFKGPFHVVRVQQWRKDNPGYWRRVPGKAIELQDPLTEKHVENQEVKEDLAKDPLQDLLGAQPVVLIGLIAHLTDSGLQDDIVSTARRLRQLGHDVLNHQVKDNGGSDVIQIPNMPGADPKSAKPVQLARSPSGP